MSKENTLSFAVATDSNALYPKDPTRLVSDKFHSTWGECAKHAKLRLLIPEVVRGERLYQLVSVASASLENAKKNFDNLKAVSDLAMPPLPTVATLRTEIENKFDKWAAEIGAEIVPTQCGQIDWPRVVNDAVWRQPPFSDGENKEKGFRDCLILETLAGLIAPEATEQIVFISGDQLLRDAATARFDSRLFAAYENLDGFLTYLTVTRNQIEEAQRQISQKIIQAAPTAFYSLNSPQCVYTFFEIYRRIKQQHTAELNSLERPQKEDSDREEFFEPISNEKVFIDSTQYEASTSKNKTWGWKTRIRMVRLFRKRVVYKDKPLTEEEVEHADLLERWRKGTEEVDELLKTNQVVRVAPFDILWTSICDNEANFKRLNLISIKPLPHEEEVGWFQFKYGFTDAEKPSQASSS